MKRFRPSITKPIGVLEREHFNGFPAAANRLAAWALAAVLRDQPLSDLGGVIVYKERGVDALLATRAYIEENFKDQLKPSTELEVLITDVENSTWRSAPLSTIEQVVGTMRSEVINGDR
jgi:hypothetical protein